MIQHTLSSTNHEQWSHRHGSMDYVEARDEPATETPSRPVRPSKRLLSEDGSSGTNSPTYTESETFPDEPHGSVHPMIWWMLRTIQKYVAKFNGVEGRVAVVEDQLDYGAEIANLKVTVEHLVESNKTLAGRLMRADATNCRQQTTITDLKMRSMRDDLIITTSGPAYKETREEQTESTVRKFLTDEMRIPNENNMCINSSHRMGQANGNFNRMLIARLPRRKDQTTIFDNASNLQGTNYSITKQFPPEIEERRQFAWADYRKARSNKLTAWGCQSSQTTWGQWRNDGTRPRISSLGYSGPQSRRCPWWHGPIFTADWAGRSHPCPLWLPFSRGSGHAWVLPVWWRSALWTVHCQYLARALAIT